MGDDVIDHTENPGSDAAADDKDRGASLVEYALLLALIAVVCIGAMTFLGTETSDSYDRNTQSMFHAG